MIAAEHTLTSEEERVVRQALWDLVLTPREFLEIIEGRGTRNWPSRGFCVARLLESVTWFEIVKLVQPETLCASWSEARPYVRIGSIREGMDFACRFLSQHPLPAAG